MDVALEISFYPLTQDYAPYIHALLERFRRHPGLRIETTSLSTQIIGSYEEVFALLQAEMRPSFEALAAQGQRAVFVMKVLGPLPQVAPSGGESMKRAN